MMIFMNIWIWGNKLIIHIILIDILILFLNQFLRMFVNIGLESGLDLIWSWQIKIGSAFAHSSFSLTSVLIGPDTLLPLQYFDRVLIYGGLESEVISFLVRLHLFLLLVYFGTDVPHVIQLRLESTIQIPYFLLPLLLLLDYYLLFL